MNVQETFNCRRGVGGTSCVLEVLVFFVFIKVILHTGVILEQRFQRFLHFI